jgi:DNA topoisomerase VI subunit B
MTGKNPMSTAPRLARTTFTTPRLMEFCNRKELTLQTGHDPALWPAVIVKELIDNSIDACEEAEIAPVIAIDVTADGNITITDNGPGLPVETLDKILDFAVRVSSREAYCAPDAASKETR